MELMSQSTEIAEMVAVHLTERFTLFDVGCSGGIDPQWLCLQNKLNAFGFDPVIEEVKRLNRLKGQANVSYIAGQVCGDGLFERAEMNPWSRLAVNQSNIIRDEKIKSQTFKGLIDNSWQAQTLSEEKIYLPDFIQKNGIDFVDFIKIDIDGDDFDVLNSLGTILLPRKVLGLMLEVNFHGTDDPKENTFHNVDRLMRKHGYVLFDLTKRLYSGSSLPAPYSISMPAQSNFGRPLQGDALYLRDFVDPRSKVNGFENKNSILKLAFLFCLFNKLDSAAELLIYYQKLLPGELNLDVLLDSMTSVWGEGSFAKLSYEVLMQRFEDDDPIFYPN
jgi:FkbM family methyltransferase